ncbi:MAG: NAD(P)-binding protein [Clostridia bacterium]|nr:NAD(P)-binding protein [Clostridia bacterium]
MKKYDAAVIGAGNGGLAAAIRLLQGGARVPLVEKHNLPGGFATGFRRGRFEFEASLHEINDLETAEPPGNLRVLFDELGATDKIDWIQIPASYRIICKNENQDTAMPFGMKEFIDKMEPYVPGSRKSMENFFELVREVEETQAYTSVCNGHADFGEMVKRYPNFVRTGSYSANGVFKALKMPQRAIDILATY